MRSQTERPTIETKDEQTSTASQSGLGIPETQRPPRLLDQLRHALRSRHYSGRTEECYRRWVKQFVIFHNMRHPTDMGETEINKFLTRLALEDKVSSSTQNQALCAILFLYRYVLNREIGDLGQIIRARRHALARKYPNASCEWRWQFVFPQKTRWVDPLRKNQGRHHTYPSIMQKAVKAAVDETGIAKRATCHTLRHNADTWIMPS
jgi:site-specific recombinase XerD